VSFVVRVALAFRKANKARRLRLKPCKPSGRKAFSLWGTRARRKAKPSQGKQGQGFPKAKLQAGQPLKPSNQAGQPLKPSKRNQRQTRQRNTQETSNGFSLGLWVCGFVGLFPFQR